VIDAGALFLRKIIHGSQQACALRHRLNAVNFQRNRLLMPTWSAQESTVLTRFSALFSRSLLLFGLSPARRRLGRRRIRPRLALLPRERPPRLQAHPSGRLISPLAGFVLRRFHDCSRSSLLRSNPFVRRGSHPSLGFWGMTLVSGDAAERMELNTGVQNEHVGASGSKWENRR
jgi:hypothetical protein